MTTVPLAGSAFHPLDRPRPGHYRVRGLTPAEWHWPLDLTLLLRERPDAPTVQQSLTWLQAREGARRHFGEELIRARHGFSTSDRDRVRAWAAASGVRVTGEDASTRRLTVTGPSGRLAELFGVQLERLLWQRHGGTVEYRGHVGPVRLPSSLDGLVVGVFGLDDRPLARSKLRALDPRVPAMVAYDPPEVAAAYSYPRLPNGGAGLHLVAGMIELGGVVHQADVVASFSRLGLPAPEIVNVQVDGSWPDADPLGADVEVALDYQVLGAIVLAMAPQAHLMIVSYNAANCERGFIDAVATAAADTVHRPAAVSISWGAPEEVWSLQGMRGMDAAFAAGALHGVAYSAAAGDAGSTDAVNDGRQHAEFPASSPHVWACGGTTLLVARDHILSETVWNELGHGAGASGSGVSAVFAPPSYQRTNGIQARPAGSSMPGRGLPDGAGVADPVTGWNVLALGRLRSTGGTSAVAPMYTALWTLIAALGPRVGLPHPRLYALHGRGFNDIVSGNTGGPYTARRGWDAASGWGSPNGREIARELGVAVPRPAMRSAEQLQQESMLELG